MAETILTDGYEIAFCEAMAEAMLKGGASIESVTKSLYILYIYYKIKNKDTLTLEECEEDVLEIRELTLMGGEKEEGHRKLQQELYDFFVGIGVGTFTLTDVYNGLSLKTKDEKSAGRVALNRFISKGVIQRESIGKSGMYRIVDTKADLIDISNADTKSLPIKLPLQVHEFVKLFKSNVVIIAGESNSGKTAYCLNIARMNKDIFPINYLSSEMQDGTELRIRLDEFGIPISAWKGVEFRFRTDNYPDVINPNAINIIDYLDEGHSEIYKIPRKIKEISDKLKDGIAVVALQKSSVKQFGLGGEATMNTSRLYLTITRQGVLTIEKAKIFRDKTINPNMMFCNFTLAAGCSFKVDGVWRKKV